MVAYHGHKITKWHFIPQWRAWVFSVKTNCYIADGPSFLQKGEKTYFQFKQDIACCRGANAFWNKLLVQGKGMRAKCWWGSETNLVKGGKSLARYSSHNEALSLWQECASATRVQWRCGHPSPELASVNALVSGPPTTQQGQPLGGKDRTCVLEPKGPQNVPSTNTS